jgi:hypothetical protein
LYLHRLYTLLYGTYRYEVWGKGTRIYLKIAPTGVVQ